MYSLRPESAAAMTAHRREAIRLAKAQEKAVSDKCARSGQPNPGYTFDELIGKGSFGRVYKGRKNSTRQIVALKVLDIDDADFQAFGDMKDEQIRDFNKEIQILRRAQESGAENLNQMIEAFAVHSQLWMVCEYCPGGSVKTLMRATNDRLEEKYLIVVARELAKALKGLHQAGIMHRDVKAANVLIHENGGLQVCDFGIAAALEGHTDKRRTFVGTFHWMPPELWADKPEYSDEVDVWGYGCTLYECAMGTPPNSDVRERQQLKVRMRRLKQSIGLPEKEQFSDGLRSLVKFALNPDAASRPSMQDILQHDFLAGTEEKYPNRSLAELVQHYYGWLFGGGQRVSLFMPGGAAAASEAPEIMPPDMADEWNFSMTQDFEHRMSTILDIPDMSELARNFEFGEGETTPKASVAHSIPSPPKEMTATEKANFELRVKRGADLSNLFDHAAPNYEYKAKRDFIPIREPESRRTSDLPFRAMAEDRPSSIASVAIDLGDFDEDDYAMAAPKTGDDRIQTTYAAATPQKEEPAFILPDAATIRAKRADSKGPRDPSAEEETRPNSAYEPSSDPTTKEWTSKKEPELQAAAEITPTSKPATKARDTMGWSFADAMSEIDSSAQESVDVQPTHDSLSRTEASAAQKAKKHATMEWSFSMAMAEAEDKPQMSPGERTPGRPTRPAPLQRIMTEPVTSHELHEVYDDFNLSSRPSTSMSDDYSESELSSTDFDPFGLDRRTPYDDDDDGPGDAELEDIGGNEFYTARGRAVTPSDTSGPGPDVTRSVTGLGLNGDINTLPYTDGPPERAENGVTENGSTTPVTASLRAPLSPRQSGHIRNSGSGASRGSVLSGPSHRSTGSGSSTSSTRTSHHISTSASGASGSSGSSASTAPHNGANRHINLAIPAPPSIAAMSFDASPSTVEKELGRLLGDFQEALGVVSDVIADRIADDSRGRARRRMIPESGSEWEDEE